MLAAGARELADRKTVQMRVPPGLLAYRASRSTSSEWHLSTVQMRVMPGTCSAVTVIGAQLVGRIKCASLIMSLGAGRTARPARPCRATQSNRTA
jgi:hypothetical protein